MLNYKRVALANPFESSATTFRSAAEKCPADLLPSFPLLRALSRQYHSMLNRRYKRGNVFLRFLLMFFYIASCQGRLLFICELTGRSLRRRRHWAGWKSPDDMEIKDKTHSFERYVAIAAWPVRWAGRYSVEISLLIKFAFR
jgi:hypothetical protein